MNETKVKTKSQQSKKRQIQSTAQSSYGIYHYPLDGVVYFVNIYAVDSDLPGGQRYPAFEQLALSVWWTNESGDLP